MGIIYNSLTPTEGLILSLDSANRRSYPGSGSTWFDLSGNGNNGSLVNGPALASGPVGGMSFDGIDDYIIVNHSPLMTSLSNGSTWSLWFRASVLNTFQNLISKPSFNSFEWRISSGNKIQFNGGSSSQITGSVTININTWYHACLVFRSSSVISYINSIQDANGLFSLNNNISNINIGRRLEYTDFYFNGQIDDIRIYNRVLSPAEISILFNSKRMRYGL